MKRTIPLLRTLVLTVAMLAAYVPATMAWTGSGTSATPYLISSVADLQTLATNVNGGNNYSGQFFLLTADLDLAGSASNQWTAIGTSAKSFQGTFDGGGHTLSGLYIDKPTAGYQGLFGCSSGATVRNLTLANPIVKATGDVAAVVGNAFSSRIEAIRIIGGTLASSGDVGGVVGYLSNSTATACLSSVTSLGSTGGRGSLVGCNFSGTVSSSYYTAISGFYSVGRGSGIVTSVTAKTIAQMNDAEALNALNAALSPGNSYRYVANPNTDEMPLLISSSTAIGTVNASPTLRLSADKGAIVVDGLENATPCTVYTLDGTLVRMLTATAETQVVPVPAGVYIVRTPQAVGKVVVP